jgi:hypothetical protein
MVLSQDSTYEIRSRPTPRITRPPASYPKYDEQRVAGRVHALVRPR